MKPLQYSFIVPVYNRPQEIDELLSSFCYLLGDLDYEIVIIEDGSTNSSKDVVSNYINRLHISYYYKTNSGPGDSRNYGMQKAKGNYYIILDSDVILPENYLIEVNEYLKSSFYHCFGGPDAAHESFTNLQKAINFTMTSFLTTGGIRGGSEKINKFQPRSFNMGLSKEAFKATLGFGKIHPGEDPDLVLRLQKLGYKTTLIPKAFVYHKRRISWTKFYKQVNKFGQVRPILTKWHPDSSKITYWLPSMFTVGLILAICLTFLNNFYFISIYGIYFLLVFILSFVSTKNVIVSLQSVLAILVQFFGYGYGFLKTTVQLILSNTAPEKLFPNLFFK
ncbi:MAG: glycosyltransferase [Winogradskyella sp.]|uniref:glycosyltransferase n=1 Tax=Winogradskyella sp. TaxID=1883156 RepID=UPI000F3DBBF9|nr:glycosyltransferase [Winogradskyella sp.]RNC79801.1 MAG: glycosyltransferase [Winogradskyella sp.]